GANHDFQAPAPLKSLPALSGTPKKSRNVDVFCGTAAPTVPPSRRWFIAGDGLTSTLSGCNK
ncbi:MAG: hypothetical protein WCJ09_27120, partial [Planctomycetota bacterium]